MKRNHFSMGPGCGPVRIPVNQYSQQSSLSHERSGILASSRLASSSADGRRSPRKGFPASASSQLQQAPGSRKLTEEDAQYNSARSNEKSPLDSFLDFYESIPEYQEVTHLSDQEFSRKMKLLRERQRLYLGNSDESSKYSTNFPSKPYKNVNKLELAKEWVNNSCEGLTFLRKTCESENILPGTEEQLSSKVSPGSSSPRKYGHYPTKEEIDALLMDTGSSLSVDSNAIKINTSRSSCGFDMDPKPCSSSSTLRDIETPFTSTGRMVNSITLHDEIPFNSTSPGRLVSNMDLGNEITFSGTPKPSNAMSHPINFYAIKEDSLQRPQSPTRRVSRPSSSNINSSGTSDLNIPDCRSPSRENPHVSNCEAEEYYFPSTAWIASDSDSMLGTTTLHRTSRGRQSLPPTSRSLPGSPVVKRSRESSSSKFTRNKKSIKNGKGSQKSARKLNGDSFAERNLSRSTPDLDSHCRSPSPKLFRARPIPRNLFSNYVYQKKQEEEFYRALKRKIRAEEMLRAASLPPSMEFRDRLTRVQVEAAAAAAQRIAVSRATASSSSEHSGSGSGSGSGCGPGDLPGDLAGDLAGGRDRGMERGDGDSTCTRSRTLTRTRSSRGSRRGSAGGDGGTEDLEDRLSKQPRRRQRGRTRDKGAGQSRSARSVPRGGPRPRPTSAPRPAAPRAPPDFAKCHEKLREELSERQSRNITTSQSPYSLRTSSLSPRRKCMQSGPRGRERERERGSPSASGTGSSLYMYSQSQSDSGTEPRRAQGAPASASSSRRTRCRPRSCSNLNLDTGTGTASSSASRSNLAALLRAQTARQRMELEHRRQREEQSRRAESRLRARLTRLTPAWRAIQYSTEEDLALRAAARREEERARRHEHGALMRHMLHRVHTIPTLFERQSHQSLEAAAAAAARAGAGASNYASESHTAHTRAHAAAQAAACYYRMSPSRSLTSLRDRDRDVVASRTLSRSRTRDSSRARDVDLGVCEGGPNCPVLADLDGHPGDPDEDAADVKVFMKQRERPSRPRERPGSASRRDLGEPTARPCLSPSPRMGRRGPAASRSPSAALRSPDRMDSQLRSQTHHRQLLYGGPGRQARHKLPVNQKVHVHKVEFDESLASELEATPGPGPEGGQTVQTNHQQQQAVEEGEEGGEIAEELEEELDDDDDRRGTE